jgi:hypothetical protein
MMKKKKKKKKMIMMVVVMIIMCEWWQLYLRCEQPLARFRLGEKRTWKPKIVVQGAKIIPFSRRYLV